jgi:hypothetical protein
MALMDPGGCTIGSAMVYAQRCQRVRIPTVSKYPNPKSKEPEWRASRYLNTQALNVKSGMALGCGRDESRRPYNDQADDLPRRAAWVAPSPGSHSLGCGRALGPSPGSHSRLPVIHITRRLRIHPSRSQAPPARQVMLAGGFVIPPSQYESYARCSLLNSRAPPN